MHFFHFFHRDRVKLGPCPLSSARTTPRTSRCGEQLSGDDGQGTPSYQSQYDYSEELEGSNNRTTRTTHYLSGGEEKVRRRNVKRVPRDWSESRGR